MAYFKIQGEVDLSSNENYDTLINGKTMSPLLNPCFRAVPFKHQQPSGKFVFWLQFWTYGLETYNTKKRFIFPISKRVASSNFPDFIQDCIDGMAELTDYEIILEPGDEGYA